MQASNRTFESFSVGESCIREHVVDEALVKKFAKLSGDHNPLHGDAQYAATTQFKKPVVHGMLFAALVSELVGMHLPGKRCLIVKTSLSFHRPVFHGDTVQLTGTILHKSNALRLLEIGIAILDQKELVVEGSVHVKVL
jgi:3-hydroxybutyryl-CoA dehydratase